MVDDFDLTSVSRSMKCIDSALYGHYSVLRLLFIDPSLHLF